MGVGARCHGGKMLKIQRIRETFIDWCVWAILAAMYLLTVPSGY
jgi:hypothetical protein